MSEILFISGVLEEVIKYLYEFSLYNLMQTCKTLRNMIGLSNVWEKQHLYIMRFDDVLNVDVMRLFEIFKSLKICKTNFAIREYYGKSYYLFVMKSWIRTYRTFWSAYLLVNNPYDVEKLHHLCVELKESISINLYKKWIKIIPYLSEQLSKINDVEKDEILKRIYITSIRRSQQIRCEFYLTGRNIKYVTRKKPSNEKLICSDLYSSVYAGKFFYNVEYERIISGSSSTGWKNYFYVRGCSDEVGQKCTIKQFVEKMESISVEMGFDKLTLIKIIFYIVSLNYTNCRKYLESVYEMIKNNTLDYYASEEESENEN